MPGRLCDWKQCWWSCAGGVLGWSTSKGGLGRGSVKGNCGRSLRSLLVRMVGGMGLEVWGWRYGAGGMQNGSMGDGMLGLVTGVARGGGEG